MGGLDMKKLNDLEDDFAADGGAVQQASKLGKETDIRILPPLDNMNGVYVHKLIVWWIKNKPYQSNSTFGGADVIAEEVEAARKERDKDLDKLLSNDKMLSQRKSWLMPVLILKTEFEGGHCTKCKVEKAVILSVGKTLGGAIHAEVTGRYAKNFVDRVNGNNIVINKKGSGMDTEYSAKIWQDKSEIKEKSFYEEENIPDVIAELERNRKKDSELRAAIRNYLYGESAKADEDDEEEETEPKPKKKGTSSGRSSRSTDEDEDDKPSRGSSRGRSTDDDQDDEDYKPRASSKASSDAPKKKVTSKKASSSIDDDIEDID